MKKIHPLPHHIIAKIAAGEVIERPVFAVKELIENSLDAHADSIIITIEESGLKKIVVIDNGEGMGQEDLEESIKAHTTSKLSNIDGLAHIKTLGFRGEALSSIAAISKMTISSRIKNSSKGTSIRINNGNVEKISPIGIPIGTTVTVEQLFHTLPARKKFLKSPRTEFHHILDLVTCYALSYPHIHFNLIHNGKTIFDLPATKEPLQRIEKLLGKDIFASLIPLSFNDSHISISGFLAKPSLTTRTPNKQFLFINNRWVNDKVISSTIKSAYGSVLASNGYPICVLYFSLPFEMVDVNVHPRKEYVRFVDTQLLQESITRAVHQVLGRYDLTPDSTFTSLSLSDAVGSTESYAGKLLKERKTPWELSQKITIDYASLVQIHNVYILIPTVKGLLLVDQHAAHERILYEQLLEEFNKEKKQQNSFIFTKPGIFDLTYSETELLLEHLDFFQKIGWEIEHFKGTTFVIRSLPVLFQDRDYLVLLKEILEDLEHEQSHKIDIITHKMIAYIACHSAVRAGDTLTKKQMEELLKQLNKTFNNSNCPHGRPTRVSIELANINKMFKR
ncbi:MAG TPA: DNA mismatch repair endonuclease MutL [Candidatus Saccharimonadales bacterium]|nr:DNA mismatch repair endonuclease MutL [Candidatus Saccharimonadales bacterium]